MFHINVDALSPLEAFPYLGRTIANNNSIWTAVYHNLKKAQRQWGMIAQMLAKTVAMVHSRWMMYKVVAQLVILCSSDSWVVMGVIIKVLEGFHHREARRKTGMTATHEAVR